MAIYDWAYELLKSMNISHTGALYGSLAINVALMLIVAAILHVISRKILVYAFEVIANRSKTRFDDFLIRSRTPSLAANMVPLLFIYHLVPVIFGGFRDWELIFIRIINISIVILVLLILRSVLNATRDYLKELPNFNDKPIDSYIQVIMIVLWIFGISAIIMSMFNVGFGGLLGTFGAISAVVLLIFKDTILGFVASIQVSVNDIVRIGDWITIEKYGADGDVIEINLATVKVRNFDNTTTTVPTYSLISDSFRNWRGMMNSGGRRIKRHILIKAHSVRFVSPEELQEFRKIQLLESYIDHRQADIEKFNRDNGIDKSVAINGRNLTNLGLFRKYISDYIEKHPAVNKDMTMMCRHLQPTEKGIPVEIYVFTADKRWVNYEHIMADIFDHIIAAVPYFGLEIFELPSDKGFIEA